MSFGPTMSLAFRRLPDRGVLSWAAIGAAAIAAVVACARPAFEIGLGASIGAGNDQRVFDYERQLTPLTDLRPWSPLMLAAALVLLATSVTALLWGNRRVLVLLACAVALLSLRAVLSVNDAVVGAEGKGVIGYEEPNGGLLLQPAIDALKADARRSPEAREPGWELLGGEHGYRARGLDGWWLLQRLVAVVSLLTAYRVFRLLLPPWGAAALTAIAAFVVLVWLFLQGLSGLQ
jgi:hypothetical protein